MQRNLPSNRLEASERFVIASISATVGVVVFIAAFMGLQGTSGIGLLDQPTLLWMVGHRIAAVTTVATALTILGDPKTVGAVCCLIALVWFLWKREIWRPLVLVGSLGAADIIAHFVKTATANPRPAETFMLPPLETNFSFPSGHTIGVTVLLLTLGYLLYSRRPERWNIGTWVALAVFTAALIAFTRLYLAAHWLTDVLAGFGLGCMVLAAVIVVDHLVMSRIDVEKPFPCRDAHSSRR